MTSRPRRLPGEGSQRQRRPGVWEIRVPTGQDPVTGRTRHRSVTVHGTEAQAEAARAALTAATSPATAGLPPGSVMKVGELLVAWLAADHPWKPSTTVGYRSTVSALTADPLAQARVLGLSPRLLREVASRWQRGGVTASVTAARVRVLRSAIGWAWDERLIETHPVRFMRGPSRVPPRRPLTEDQVRCLLAAAELRPLEAHANHAATPGGARSLLRAEQDLLLVRLAADTGARRGELAALQIADLDGRVLRIDRAVSAGVLTTPKSGHGRVLTLGSSTAGLWHTLAAQWETRTTTRLGPWLFAADPGHHHRLGAETLGRRFDQIRAAADLPEATLHRLRHSVATFLVSRGQILQAQARLGHADAATTLREYAYALPLTDTDVADALDTHLNTPRTDPITDHQPHPGAEN